ncbi:MAG: Hpt domain-containing protein [Candidatus Magnetoovum sp. WYHC-5]|nr:Hpt domain-containing protein [Candidatus Magnetoovum sp. WYHC-5]
MNELMERVGGDKPIILEVWRAFLEDAPVRMQVLKDAITSNLVQEAEREAHTLKGMAANIGAPILKQEAMKMELATKKVDLTDANLMYESLHYEYMRVIDELERFISTEF